MATEVDGATDCRVTYIEDRFNVIFAREKLQSFFDGAGPDAMSLLSKKLPNGKRVVLIKVSGGGKCVESSERGFVVLLWK